MRIFNRRLLRPVAMTILVGFFVEIAAPVTVLALTGGPTQPEFSSFEPVATTSMVNEFTGAFTYNLPVLQIPGPNGSGYALSLSYHSGSNAEDDASWVGYGWTLNPGAITRNKRGFADDSKKEEVTYWNKVDANWTVTAGYGYGIEFFSSDDPVEKAKLGPNGGISGTTVSRYNNYQGFSYTATLGAFYKGVVDVNVGLTTQDGETTFRPTINPASTLLKHLGLKPGVEKILRKTNLISGIDRGVNAYGMFSFGKVERALNYPAYDGESFNFTAGIQYTAMPLPIGLEGKIIGSYSRQKNRESETAHAYGYLYSGEAVNDYGGEDYSVAMDYYVEKSSPYNKRDRFLSIPFSNADNFMVSGEGVGGGFRAYSSTAGHFFPGTKSSEYTIGQLSGDLHIGSNIGVGIDAGIGWHSMDMVRGATCGAGYKFPKSGDGEPEPYFFRFNNDPGGSVEFAGANNINRVADDVVRASQGSSGPIAPNDIDPIMNNGKRSGRSSMISYRTNQEMQALPRVGCFSPSGDGEVFYKSHNRDAASRGFVDRSGAVENGIGEFAVTKENGTRYVYGLPVYSTNEKDLQYGLVGLGDATTDDHQYLVHTGLGVSSGLNLPKDAPSVVGEERNAPYASMHLLTEITTPDYVDRTGDGPTPDDLGGYTKFSYVRTAGENSKTGGESWYQWRAPYDGLLLNRGSLSDSRNITGTVSQGQKEIYYLKSIETKTHVAVFVTNKANFDYGSRTVAGSNVERKDAFEARHDARAAALNDGASPTTGSNKLRFLERIELYAKDAAGNPGTLITTTNFAYSYKLCRNLPNSATDGGDRAGKLTLERLWFDHQGAHSARITPYVFHYDYRTSGQSDPTPYASSIVSGPYAAITRHGDTLTAADQNPAYSAFNIDRWGQYQIDMVGGVSRHAKMKHWVNQAQVSGFDPAAWHLKRIQLPSGGEIQVQYEQHSYDHVQDRRAMVMVPLKRGTVSDTKSLDPRNDGFKYYLDLSGFNFTQAQKDELLGKLQRYALAPGFGGEGNPLYFKFLYSLDGETDPVISPTNCTSEYIDGYMYPSGIVSDNNDICVQLTSSSGQFQPWEVANNFFKTQRNGILTACDLTQPGLDNSLNTGEIILGLLGLFNTNDWATRFLKPWYYNPSLSYIRIPLPDGYAKKAGGARVKRLLMYDAGIEAGDAALYGSEYIYQDGDGSSSGVATNEPVQGREENALVMPLAKREPQGTVEMIISGEDKDEFEGPLGESILPAASIGYARVVTKNIHSGKTNPGYTVSEFYTARDFPFDMNYSDPAMRKAGSILYGKGADHTAMDQNDDWIMFTVGICDYQTSLLKRSQGYRFVINDMHGQPRRIASYGGNVLVPGQMVLTGLQEYEYFMPGEPIPVLSRIDADDIEQAFLGKETEVVFESRGVMDITNDIKLQLDVSLGMFLIPLPFGSAFPSYSYSENGIATHVTTKVIRYPAIVKSSTTMRDGIVVKVENVAFNPDNGQPVITRTSDGYDKLVLQQQQSNQPPRPVDPERPAPIHNGLYYNVTIPASQQYRGLSQKAINEGAVIPTTRRGQSPPTDGLVINKRYYQNDRRHWLNFVADDPIALSGALSLLTPGDMVSVTTRAGGEYIGIYKVGRIAGLEVELLSVPWAYATTNPIDDDVQIEIVHSGRSNQLDVVAGTFTTYGRLPIPVSKHPVGP